MFVRIALAIAVGVSLGGCATSSSHYRGGVAYSYDSGPSYYGSVSPYDAYFGYDPYYRGYGYGGYGYGPVYFGYSSIGIATFGGYCSVEYRACLPWWYGSGYDPYWRFGYTYGYGGYWNYYGWGGWGWPHHGHDHDHDGHHDHDGDHDGHGQNDHDQGQAGNGGASDGSDIFRPRPERNPRPEREPRDRFYEGESAIGLGLERERAADEAEPAAMRMRQRPDWRRWQGPRNEDGQPMAYPRPSRQADGAEPRSYPTPRPWQEEDAAPPRPRTWPRESRPNDRPDASPRPGSRSESRRADPPARSESRSGSRNRSRDDRN